MIKKEKTARKTEILSVRIASTVIQPLKDKYKDSEPSLNARIVKAISKIK